MIRVACFLKNKILLYLSTRYITYFVLFLNFLFLSAKLGPYNYGIWGFITMIISYYRIFDFGIPNSLNVLIVQNKDNEHVQKEYMTASLCAIGLLCAGVVVISVLYYFHSFKIFDKFELGNYFYAISVIAILEYINKLFSKVYRVKGELLYVSIYQSIVPLLTIFIILIFPSDKLITWLLISYILGGVIPLILFISGGEINCCWPFEKSRFSFIIKKGLFLFFYNSSFYLILTAISLIISSIYTVEEYGFYTFSYMLGHCVLMFLEAFSFLIYPKLLDKLYNKDKEHVQNVIATIRINYIDLSHFILYIAFSLFPLFLIFFPEYRSALLSINIVSLSIILSTNSFGYNTYLIANNHERIAALISVLSLLVCIITALLLALVLNVHYSFVPLSLLISYLFFAYGCAYWTYKDFSIINIMSHLNNVFPFRQFIPYVIALLIAVLNLTYLSVIPLIVFSILNHSSLKQSVLTAKKVLDHPNIINV